MCLQLTFEFALSTAIERGLEGKQSANRQHSQVKISGALQLINQGKATVGTGSGTQL